MESLIAKTLAGSVEGVAQGGVRRWLGVPYARAARFAAPEPVARWDGVRPAQAMAPQCPQHFGGSPKTARLAQPDYAEDCLALNVWTPVGGDGAPKPVFVWIHGGAFMAGGSNAYDGAELAQLGDMVVVGINYRLGVLGFVNFGEALGLPAIPSNLGLRDQIAALEWVRDNIAAFGGDPGRVTIAGESAGSMSVSLLMLCRKAWPLFHGAIMQSGAVSLIHSQEKSRQVGRRYAERLGLNQGDLAVLKDLPLERLFEAQAAIGKAERNGIPAAPWFDGDLLPASLDEAHAHPTPPVPLLAGSNREEIRLFELMPGDILPTRWPDLEALLRSQLPPDQAEQVLAAYPRTRVGRQALATDLTFGMPTRNFAERHARAHPTWFYRFDYAHPLVGAAHGLDLTLLWPLQGLKAALARGGPLTGRRRALAERIRSNWAHFTRHGRPQTDWPAYTADARQVRIFDLDDRILADPEPHRFAAWAGKDVGPGLAADPA
ncbi:carboxylesterase family protein [Phenylobacterium sp. LjRoot219]|uniref:carboxylesterase/lipase family protein n=1 Tax=Phenylobacterium sp. LjRoot219 TaxID=3342283 RepID=UPI003ECC7214